jgi:hypothetical protein
MTQTVNKIAGTLFKQFPKSRQPLPLEYLSIYESEYLANRTAGGIGNSIARILESWMHKKVANSVVIQSESILEIGAGSLNHLRWENSYANYDIVEPFQKLIETSPNLRFVRHKYKHINEVAEWQQYDRIISIAVLEHLLDLPREIALSGLILKEGGKFCAGIPSEGGWLWKMAWKYGTGPGFARRTGLDYEKLMKYEHVNTVDEIEECIRFFFGSVAMERFPLQVKSFSLYSFFVATNPNKERCENYLKQTT